MPAGAASGAASGGAGGALEHAAHAPLLAPPSAHCDSSEADEEGDDWVAVPTAVVEAWREAAYTGKLLRGASLDGGASAAALLSATTSFGALRVVASCSDLQSLGAVPGLPGAKLPPMAAPVAPSMSSGSGARVSCGSGARCVRCDARGAPAVARIAGLAGPMRGSARQMCRLCIFRCEPWVCRN